MSDLFAKWTLNPIAERELAEERRLFLTIRRIGWIGLSAFCILIPLCNGVPSPVIQVASTCLLLGLGAAFLRGSMKIDELRVRRRIALREDSHPVSGWIVDLAIYRGACLIGKDRGVIWFEDDRMYFAGQRTSFGFLAGETEGNATKAWRVDGVRSSLTLPLKHSDGFGNVSLGFDAAASGSSLVPPGNSFSSLAATICKWRTIPSSGKSQRPPLAIGPNVPPARRLLLQASTASLFWTTALFLAFWTGESQAWFSPVPILAALIVSIVCPEVRFPLRRWQAFRHRLRFDRDQRNCLESDQGAIP